MLRVLKSVGGEIRCLYEAGPCGFDLYRYLIKHGVGCEVAAPSLTPRKPGERVKTNKRDAKKLATLDRAGELTLIIVPTPEREAVRDVTRARDAARKDLQRNRHRLSKFLLRHGRRLEKTRAWSVRHWSWIRGQKFESEHLTVVLQEMIVAVEQASDALARWDKRIGEVAGTAPYAPFVAALRVMRGIDTLSAMILLVELGDLRRFHSAPALMAAVGLVPSEQSTGDHQNRFGITKTGNARARHILVEAAWHHTRRPVVSKRVLDRRSGQDPALVEIARRADGRLHTKYKRMVRRHKKPVIAVTATARELAGFLWAIGQHLNAIPN